MREPVQFVRLVASPGVHAEPGADRPALQYGQGRYHVRRRGVAREVQAEGDLRHDREYLKSHVPIDESRYVYVAASMFSEQIPIPQQCVRMEVGDPQLTVQLSGGARTVREVDASLSIGERIDHPRRHQHDSENCRDDQGCLHTWRWNDG